VREGVKGTVAVNWEPGVSVKELGWVEVWNTVPVLVGDEPGARVSVAAEEVVGLDSREKIRLTTEFPNAMVTNAKNISARENPSHCLPVIIRAWRVR
jgi:hypothetical protein